MFTEDHRCRNGFQHFLGNHFDIRNGAYVFQHNRKFIATQACDAVGVAHFVDQAARDRFDHHIAISLSVVVVDIGELIDIDIEQGGIEAVAFRPVHGAFHVRPESHPVECAGERVAIGELLNLLSRFFQLDAVVENAVDQGVLQLPADQVVLCAVSAQEADGGVLGFIQQ